MFGALKDIDIDRIIFNNQDCFDGIMSAQGEAYDTWGTVPSIENGFFALAPGLMHNWAAFPMFSQTIGLMWMGKLMWPLIYDFDMVRKTQEFYELFFDYSISDDQAVQMLGQDREV